MNYICRVLARPYVIFPIHLNLQIRSRCVLKAIIHRKNSVFFYSYLRKIFLFQKGTFLILYMHVIFLFYLDLFQFFVFLYLSFIYYLNIWRDIFIKRGKFLKVLWHFIHLLQYYPQLNDGHHTKSSNLGVC